MEVLFLPINQKITVNHGENLFQASREHGIDLGGVCSGGKTCGKCKVLITKGNTSPLALEELNTLTEEEIRRGMRLACCFSCTQDTCVILLDTNITKAHAKTDMNCSSSDVYNGNVNNSNEKLRNEKLSNEKPDNENTSIYDSKNLSGSYGVAIDIGTTQVAALLWDIEKRCVLCEKSEPNPQYLYGMDVISRITFGSKSNANAEVLCKLIQKCCNQIINQMVSETNVNPKKIESIVVVGNTTMIHIFLERPLSNLLKVPFSNINYDGVECRAIDLGFLEYKDALIYVLPGIHGHVGSDTMGCIIEKNLHSIKGITLLVDIGTNGEIVLAKDGKIVVCSTAAGPAFEGATLQQGMVAKEGAITSVRIVGDKISVDYIGSDKENSYPIGICGTGVLEALAEFYANGYMDSTGRLLNEYGLENCVTLYNDDYHRVVLTQKDIREIQLAKGAIYAGIILLLKDTGISIKDVDRIYLAGAFGSKTNYEKIIKIGLLPKVNINIIKSIGNAALNGASKFLLGDISKKDIDVIAANCSYLELATNDEFNEVFIDSISFPDI